MVLMSVCTDFAQMFQRYVKETSPEVEKVTAELQPQFSTDQLQKVWQHVIYNHNENYASIS